MNAISIKNVNFSYNEDPVLTSVNLTLKEGDIAVLIGENGSGKSTLVKLILGELKLKKGQIEVLGKTVDKFKEVYSSIGYVPQNTAVNKISFPVTCLEMVVQNRYKDFGFFKFPKKKDKLEAKEILKKLNLAEYINTPFNELSGGLQQRVMIARALINKPSLLILDEPTAGIDKHSKQQLLHLIQDIQKKQALSILLITHEYDLIKTILPEIKLYQIKDGELNDISI